MANAPDDDTGLIKTCQKGRHIMKTVTILGILHLLDSFLSPLCPLCLCVRYEMPPAPTGKKCKLLPAFMKDAQFLKRLML